MLYNRKSYLGLGEEECNFFSTADDKLHELLMTEKKTIHYISNGDFALHDVVISVAKKMAKPKIVIASFNISSDAAACLIRGYERGFFCELKLILNGAKKSNSTRGIAMVQGKFELKFTNNHAKIALLSDGSSYAVIQTSGNLSASRNLEVGTIYLNNKNLYEFHQQWMLLN